MVHAIGKRRRYVLLDRDGTIIIDRVYLSDPEGVELIQGAASGLRKLSSLGLGLIIVTNQSAIGRGHLDLPGLARVHDRLTDLLANEGIVLDGIYFCPHLPTDNCKCRKPRTGMVEQAQADLHFDPTRSFMIGDNSCDMELGRAVGATPLLVRTGHGKEIEAQGDLANQVVRDNLEDAAAYIENLLGR